MKDVRFRRCYLHHRSAHQLDASGGSIHQRCKPGVVVFKSAAVHQGADDIRDGVVHCLI